ncbi:hypothetical protein WH47_01850 [Habropoda laboriosa]|uniref:Uncharacterized protein n=1 Tax=Habropoda laboriosa TaxID=597456 RepID=A0A0L7QTS7_9HYME|nr:hypothetical protein WH47_01850 [Habropoda laboriosa]
MTSFYDSYDYYKKMLDLQEKLRKSEEERIRLEERFKILVQESRNRHDACINRLRLRYIEFLEEQRTRDERNHKLLEALDKVDNSLALMTAKTDRLNILRKQYEAYLRRIYTVPIQSESIIDDNNIPIQGESRYLRKDATVEPIHLSSEIKNTPSPQMWLLNDQTNWSISPSATSFTKSAQNTYYNNYQPSTVQQKNLNQLVNGSQNASRMYSTILQNDIQQSPTQNVSSQIFQHKQPYVPIDPNLHVPRVSSCQPSSLSQPTVPHFNKPTSDRMETAQNISHFIVPERTNESMSPYKFLDVSQNRFTPVTPQHYIHPSSISTQSFRQENDKISLDNMQTQVSNVDEIPSVYRTMPVIAKRNVYGIPSLNKSLNLSKRTFPSYTDYSWRKPDYLKKSVNDTPVRSLTTSDVDNMIRRHKRFTSKSLSGTRSPINTKQLVVDEEDEHRTATIVENELDRYIDKIRKLHRDLDTQSLEEIDQDMTVIPNVSSSNVNLELLNEDQPKEDLPKEVEKVLALAEDLVSRTVVLNDANDSGKGHVDKNRNLELVESTQSDTPISERNYVAFADTREGRETSVAFAKDEISNDIKLHEPKLDSHQNIEKLEKQNITGLSNTHPLEQYEQQLHQMQENERVDFNVSSNEKEQVETNVQRQEYNEEDNFYLAEESDVDQHSFDVVDELEPWDLDCLQKRIKEINLTGETEDQSSKKELVVDASKLNQDNVEQIENSNKVNTVESDKNEQNSKEESNMNETNSDITKDQSRQETTKYPVQKEDSIHENVTETSETSVLPEKLEHEDKSYNNENVMQINTKLVQDQVDERNDLDNKQTEECNETKFVPDTNEQEIVAQTEEYTNENYYEDPNQAQNYAQNYETEYTDPNYDPNVTYENNPNQEYQEYINQEYAQESNEQYGAYVGEQYGSRNQYEHEPNVQYQEDANQEYAYTYEQQYDPNQVSDTDANQPFAYTDYDPNQSQLTQEEDKQDEEYKEVVQEASKHEDTKEEKVDTVQSKNEKLSSEKEPKKTKDVIKSLLDSDTDSTIERNVSNTESDFDFN